MKNKAIIITICILLAGAVWYGVNNYKKPAREASTTSSVTNSDDFKFICPENYESDQMQENLIELLVYYTKKFPEATVGDYLTYRYSLLVKNNCQKTLDYIKNQAKGEDPLSSYIKKTLQDMQDISQNDLNSSSNEVNTLK